MVARTVLLIVVAATLNLISILRAAPPATAPVKLAHKPEEIVRDDGKVAGKKSMAGSGHVVVFDSPLDIAYLTAVKIHGSRYGAPRAPDEDFSVWVCDAKGTVLHELSFPYSSFQRGEEKWVVLTAKEPVAVPERFMLIVGFDPTQTKGIYVSHDAERDNDSRVGLPGKIGNKFNKGDWMIRAVIDPPQR